MTKYFLIAVVALICGILIGFWIGISHMIRRAADGVCIRADDGEAYLRVSEAGQKKILDPSTRLLYIRVINISTRNKQLL